MDAELHHRSDGHANHAAGGRIDVAIVDHVHHAALVGHMCNLSYKAGQPVRWNKATRKVEV